MTANWISYRDLLRKEKADAETRRANLQKEDLNRREQNLDFVSDIVGSGLKFASGTLMPTKSIKYSIKR